MLYKKNQSASLDAALFENPTEEYRGTPFWAWNGKLNNETLLEQIDMLKKMGLGGFHMHVRTGMDSPYLDEEFMGYIRLCVEKAKQEKTSFFKKIGLWFKSLKSECKKISWASLKSVQSNSTIVIICVVVISIVLGLLDYCFSNAIVGLSRLI